MKSVKITDLELGIYKVFEAIKELHGTDIQIDLDEDDYWNIKDDELYKVATRPDKMDIGSLYSDVEQLEKIVRDEMHSVPYNLKLLSAVLRFVATKV